MWHSRETGDLTACHLLIFKCGASTHWARSYHPRASGTMVKTYLPIKHHCLCTHARTKVHILASELRTQIWLAKGGKLSDNFNNRLCNQGSGPINPRDNSYFFGLLLNDYNQALCRWIWEREWIPLCFWGYCGGEEGERERKKPSSGAALGREGPRCPHNQSSCILRSPLSKAFPSFGEKTEHIFRTQWNASDWWVNTAGWAGDFVITKQIF